MVRHSSLLNLLTPPPHTTSRYTTSNRATPHHSTLRDTPSCYPTPHHITLCHSTHYSTPHLIGLHHTTSPYATPHRATSHHITPLHTPSGYTTSYHPMPHPITVLDTSLYATPRWATPHHITLATRHRATHHTTLLYSGLRRFGTYSVRSLFDRSRSNIQCLLHQTLFPLLAELVQVDFVDRAVRPEAVLLFLLE